MTTKQDTLAERFVAYLKSGTPDGFNYNTVDKFILEEVYKPEWEGEPINVSFQRLERNQQRITKETLTFSDASFVTLEYYTMAGKTLAVMCVRILTNNEKVDHIVDNRPESEALDESDTLASCIMPLVTGTEMMS